MWKLFLDPHRATTTYTGWKSIWRGLSCISFDISPVPSQSPHPDNIRAMIHRHHLSSDRWNFTSSKSQQQQPSCVASSPIQEGDTLAITNLSNQKREAKEQDQLPGPWLCVQEGSHPVPSAWSPNVPLGCYRDPPPGSGEAGISCASPSLPHLPQSRQNSHHSAQWCPYSQHERGFLQVFIHSNVGRVLARSTPESFYKVMEYHRKPYNVHSHTKWVCDDLCLLEKIISKGLFMVLLQSFRNSW